MILVTGANGFIGQELCSRLSKDGFRIKAATRIANPELSQKYETIVVGEINGQTQWDSALSDVETVIHLAARVHTMQDKSTDHLEKFRAVNVIGTERLARKATQFGIRRFIFLSTIKVNGEFTKISSNGTNFAFAESDNPNPQDHYARSKWEAEQILRKIGQESNMEVVILRSPLVYGPGVKANFLNLMKLIKLRIPLPLASISNKRSLIFIGNLTDIIRSCIHSPNIKGETYLVSDGKDISTPDLIGLIAKAMKQKSLIFPFPIKALKILAFLIGKTNYLNRLNYSLQVNNDKIVKTLNWKPVFSIEEGVEITMHHYLSKR